MIKNSLAEVEISDEVQKNGKGLCILICTDYSYQMNWMTFSCWYSIYKLLPEAKVTIVSPRASRIDSYFYNWVYKCHDLRFFLHKNVGNLNKIHGLRVALQEKLVKQPLLVVEPDIMAVSELLPGTIKKMKETTLVNTSNIWFLNGAEKIEEVINTGDIEGLVGKAGDNGMVTFVDYNNCGNFNKKDWEKGRTVPPFGSAFALQTSFMSLNERKVLNLWNNMNGFWELSNQVRI